MNLFFEMEEAEVELDQLEVFEVGGCKGERLMNMELDDPSFCSFDLTLLAAYEIVF